MELTEGKQYIIDATFVNGGVVELVKIYGTVFCRVKDPDTEGEWDTSISRLTEIKKINETTNHPG